MTAESERAGTGGTGGPGADFGRQPRSYRRRAGLTRQQLGRMVGYRHSLIGRLEAGLREPAAGPVRLPDSVLGAGGDGVPPSGVAGQAGGIRRSRPESLSLTALLGLAEPGPAVIARQTAAARTGRLRSGGDGPVIGYTTTGDTTRAAAECHLPGAGGGRCHRSGRPGAGGGRRDRPAPGRRAGRVVERGTVRVTLADQRARVGHRWRGTKVCTMNSVPAGSGA